MHICTWINGQTYSPVVLIQVYVHYKMVASMRLVRAA